VNKLIFFFIFIFISACSLNSQSKFWTKSEDITKDNNNLNNKVEKQEIFKKEKILKKEFNKNLKIKINSNLSSNYKNNINSNNSGLLNFSGELKRSSRYKFSKIKNFYQYEPELIFDESNLIFFENKGTILKFNENSKLVWKKNFYLKQEKKLNPVLQFASNDKYLIVADNLAKYFMLDKENGELIWSKNNSAPFNSQIKIFKDKFFIIDFDNTLRCFSLKNGNELWNVKTQNSLIRSQKKLSMVIVDNVIFFNNSIGDISSVNLNNGELLWQFPTQNSLVYESAFSLETSEIVTDGKALYFSNNKNQFYSIDLSTGSLNWKTKVNSNLKPTIIENIIFTVSIEGYLILIDRKNGNIIRITDVFDYFKTKKRNLIKPTGFIVGLDSVYLSTDNGRLLVVDNSSGKIVSAIKIDGEKILRPAVMNNSLFVVKDNSIIKLN
tara:strand:- start:467 stop:1783 length:1317 start_codon:yes stop_codon:yes gene_type:complete